MKPNPYPNMESFRTIFKDVSDRIPAAKSAAPREFVDIRFIQELDKSGSKTGYTAENRRPGAGVG
ncbi:MAG TPA: hypothetical protein VFX54_04630 [Candidatus Binatia bacterium]|nr:hypothetical protein [Candidatus Binatia bacterium]